MSTSRRRHLLEVAALVGTTYGLPLRAAPTGKAGSLDATRELKWEELIPKAWDPAAGFRGRNTTILNDWDPKARRLMKEVQDVWDHAPTVSTFNGLLVRLAGYVVPLDTVRDALKEFLLVPYFGACIHTPPPPVNQIVLVTPRTPAEGFRMMDTVWVSGLITAVRDQTFAGTSGYRLDATTVERYTGTKGR